MEKRNYFLVNAFRVAAVLVFLWGILVCWGINVGKILYEDDAKKEEVLVEQYKESVEKEIDADKAIAGTDVEATEEVEEKEVVEEPPVEEVAVDDSKVYTAFDLVHCNGVVNVRSTPTSENNSNIIGKMQKGESGYILENVEDTWILVVTENIQGYIAKKFVDEREVTGAELEDYFPAEYR